MEDAAILVVLRVFRQGALLLSGRAIFRAIRTNSRAALRNQQATRRLGTLCGVGVPLCQTGLLAGGAGLDT
jgi:hypothetical protein